MMERDKRSQRAQKPQVDIAPYVSLVGGEVLVPDYVQKIVDLVAVGRDKEKLAIGFHGTSLAALGVAMKTGCIPTGRSEQCEGHLYFFPTSHAPLNREGLAEIDASKYTPEKRDNAAFDGAAGYAHDLTRAALAATSLKLDLSEELDWQLAGSVGALACRQMKPTHVKPTHDEDDNEAVKMMKKRLEELVERIEARLEKLGKSVEDLEGLHKQLNKPEFNRGFVLLIGRSALDEHSHHLGDLNNGDLKLRLPPEGLSLEHLVGIEPISEADFGVIEELEKRHCSGN